MATKTKAAHSPPGSPIAAPHPLPPQPPLEDVVKQIVAQSGVLDELDNRISEAIRRTESALQGCIRIRIAEPTYESETHLYYEALVFGKHNGKWGLFIETGVIQPSSGDWEPTETTALMKCSREKRCEVFAAGHIERLLRGALATFEAQIDARRAALGSVERVMSVLSALQPASSGPDDDIPF